MFKVSVSREEEFTAKPQRSQRGAEVEELFVICYLLLGKRKKWRFRLKESALRAASPYRVRDKNADENGLL